jgi:hypothetical protein
LNHHQALGPIGNDATTTAARGILSSLYSMRNTGEQIAVFVITKTNNKQ